MPYKINYSAEPKTKRVDLSELGEDEQGNPFYALILNLNALRYGERKDMVKRKFPDGVSKQDVEAHRDEYTIAAFVQEWNLVDMDTGEAVNPASPDAINRVPARAIDLISLALSTGAPEDANTKNS